MVLYMKQKNTIRKKRYSKKNTRRRMKGGFPYKTDTEKERSKYKKIVEIKLPKINVWKTKPKDIKTVRIILVRHGTGFHNDYQSNATDKSTYIERKKKQIKKDILNEDFPDLDHSKHTPPIGSETQAMEDTIKEHNNTLRGVKEIDVDKYILMCKTLNITPNMTPYDKLTDPELTYKGKNSIVRIKPENDTSGRTSARELLNKLELYKDDAIKQITTYVSPLKRTIQTAYILSNEKYTPKEYPDDADDADDDTKLSEFLKQENINIDKDCREQTESQNIFDKLKYNENYYTNNDTDKYKYYKNLFHTYIEDSLPEEKVDKAFLFTENLNSMLKRGKDFIEKIISKAKADETIIVVTHSGFLYGLLHGVFEPKDLNDIADSSSDDRLSSDLKFTAWFEEGEARDFYFRIPE
jgi:broad specificity phosphatase PhoE